jgi:hypothetical protein
LRPMRRHWPVTIVPEVSVRTWRRQSQAQAVRHEAEENGAFDSSRHRFFFVSHSLL